MTLDPLCTLCSKAVDTFRKNKLQETIEMGLFTSSGPSLNEINNYSLWKIDEVLGHALTTGRINDESFDALLREFSEYKNKHKLGIMKSSALSGNIELFLSKAVPKETRKNLMIKVQKILL